MQYQLGHISNIMAQVSVTGRGVNEKLSVKQDKAHVLFGGTKILQHTPDKVVYYCSEIPTYIVDILLFSFL